MGVLLGVAKNSNNFLGCLKFLIFFVVHSRCWVRAYVYRKNENIPPPLGVRYLNNLSCTNPENRMILWQTHCVDPGEMLLNQALFSEIKTIFRDTIIAVGLYF